MNPGAAPEADNLYWRFFRSNWKLILLLIVAFFFYLRTLGYGFVYDDSSQILANWRVQHPEYVPGYFTQHLWAHKLPAQQGSYYRPLFLVWLLANFSLFGAKAWGWHLTTVLVQLCTTVAVFRVALRLTSSNNVALLAAALFVFHPLAMQPTIWISDVDDSLCLLLMICSFLGYLNARERKSARWLVASAFLFLSALLMKETAFVLLAIIPCYAILYGDVDAAPLRRLRSSIQGLAPYAAVFLVFFLVRAYVLRSMLHPKVRASLVSSLLSLPSVVLLYARNILFPNRLALFYDLPYPTAPTWYNFWLPLVSVLVILSVLLALCFYRRSNALTFGLLWTIIVMVPPLAALPFFGEFGLVHDRYVYPAMPGLALVFALLVDRLIQNRAVLGKVCAVAVLSYVAILNWQQQGFWRNDEALYSRSVAVGPNSTKAVLGLVWLRFDSGKFDEASRLIESVLRRDPQNYDAYFARFVMKELRHDLIGAEADARKALQIRPDSPEAHAMIANTLFLQGRDIEGRVEIAKAIEGFPGNYVYHLDLGDSYGRRNDFASALKEYRIAQSLLPHDPKLRAFVSGVERKVAADAASPK